MIIDPRPHCPQDPFHRMPDDLTARELDILLELVAAVQDWLCDKYEHLLATDPEPSPYDDDYDRPDDEELPW